MSLHDSTPSIASALRVRFRELSASNLAPPWRDLFGFLGLEPLLNTPLSAKDQQSLGCQTPLDQLDWCVTQDLWLSRFEALWQRSPALPASLATLYQQLPPRFLLGRHVEAMAKILVQDLLGLEVLAHNLPICDDTAQEPRRTIGELDLVYRLHDQIRHRELAAKWYLFDPSSEVSTLPGLNCYWGPKRRDRLDLKLTRMLTHQLPLGTHPATRRTLGPASPAQQELWLCGQLYWPLDLPIRPSEPVNPAAIAGHWAFFQRWQQEAAQEQSHHWYALDKSRWLAKAHPCDLRPLCPKDQTPWSWPVLLVKGPRDPNEAWAEIARLFVVPQDWRELANPVTAQ